MTSHFSGSLTRELQLRASFSPVSVSLMGSHFEADCLG